MLYCNLYIYAKPEAGNPGSVLLDLVTVVNISIKHYKLDYKQ